MSKQTQAKPDSVSKKPSKTGWRSTRFWLKEVLTMVILFSLVTAGMDWWRSGDMPKDNAPPLVTQTIEGKQVDLLAMSEEKPVVLYFWATWCGACKVVTPTVNWLGDDYNVVSVAITSGNNKRVGRYLKGHEYDFDTINDPRGSVAQLWGISATPTIVIIKNGQVRAVTTGITTPPGLLARLWFA